MTIFFLTHILVDFLNWHTLKIIPYSVDMGLKQSGAVYALPQSLQDPSHYPEMFKLSL